MIFSPLLCKAICNQGISKIAQTGHTEFDFFAVHRYYFGVIDIFTEYCLWQRLSRWLKSLKYLSTDHSSAPPTIYADRLFGFVENHLMPDEGEDHRVEEEEPGT